MKVKSIGHIKDNALLVTPEQCIQSVLHDDLGKRGAFKKGTKILVLALDDTDGEYSFSFSQGGMKVSEMISLISVFKKYLINMMGF